MAEPQYDPRRNYSRVYVLTVTHSKMYFIAQRRSHVQTHIYTLKQSFTKIVLNPYNHPGGALIFSVLLCSIQIPVFKNASHNL